MLPRWTASTNILYQLKEDMAARIEELEFLHCAVLDNPRKMASAFYMPPQSSVLTRAKASQVTLELPLETSDHLDSRIYTVSLSCKG